MRMIQVKPTINYTDLEKVDIRVGMIVVVDFGAFKRNILVGMKKERENPKEIEGKQALFMVNLEPKEMAGEVSEGMLFDVGYANGITPVLAVPEKNVPNGVSAG